MQWYHCSDMLFLYHEPGPEKNARRPSWQQAMNWDTQSFSSTFYGGVDHDMKIGTYSYNGRCIQLAQVQELATPGAAPCKGHLIVQTWSWYRGKHQHQYKISAGHQHPIPDGEYSLLCAPRRNFKSKGTACIVGKMLPNQTFLKTSVFEVFDQPWKRLKWQSKWSCIVLG